MGRRRVKKQPQKATGTANANGKVTLIKSALLDENLCASTIVEQAPTPHVADSGTERPPMIVPLADCIRLRNSGTGGGTQGGTMTGGKGRKGHNHNNNSTGEASATTEWEVVKDDSKQEFDGHWELI